MGFTAQDPLYDTQSYFAALTYYKNWNPKFWDYNRAWLQAWMGLRDGTLFGKSIPTADPDLKVETLIKNRQTVSQPVASNTLNADGTLTINFQDPTYSAFRVEQKVDNGSGGVEGYVIAASPGQIIVKNVDNPTTFVAATHFATNSTVYARGKIGGLANSIGTTSIYSTKDKQEDYVEITRDSVQVAATQRTSRFAAEVNGEMEVYGYQQAEMDMMNNFMFYVMYKKLFGKGGTGLVGLEGEMNKTYGIRNRIIDSSNNYIPGVAPITQAQFEQILGTCVDSNPGFNQDILLLPGRRALQRLATFYPTQLGFAGGKREGDTLSVSTDLRQINFGGINATVGINFNILNDGVNLPDWMKDSIFFINRSQLTLNGQNQSICQPVHFSPNGADYSMEYAIVTGMGGESKLPSIGNYKQAISSVHGCSYEALDMSGVVMLPYGHGLFEYQH